MHGRIEAPELLEVVPWNYGYGHSWALRWLLMKPSLTDRILAAAKPEMGIPPPLRVEGGVQTEKSLTPARADLAFEVRDDAGGLHQLAVETKVADPLRLDQLAAYYALGYRPLLYLPGLTGLLAQAIPPADELRLTGGDLASALNGVDLPHFVQSYVDAVEAESERMKKVLDLERGAFRDELPRGQTDQLTLRDLAWLVLLYEELHRRNVRHEELRTRVTRHDRGIFYPGSWSPLGPNDAGVYIDVTAGIQSHNRNLAVKAGGETRDSRGEAFDIATHRGPPDATAGWRHCPRRVAGRSVTVWALDVSGSPPQDVAAKTVSTSEWMQSIAL
jgi:hypothetical protein